MTQRRLLTLVVGALLAVLALGTPSAASSGPRPAPAAHVSCQRGGKHHDPSRTCTSSILVRSSSLRTVVQRKLSIDGGADGARRATPELVGGVDTPPAPIHRSTPSRRHAPRAPPAP